LFAFLSWGIKIAQVCALCNAYFVANHGEKLACEYLRSLGFEVLEQNFAVHGMGEVDIIARDGNEVVFVEVRERGSRDFGEAEESLDFKKLERIRKVAETWLNGRDLAWRVDFLGIFGGKIEHLRGI